MSNHLDRKQTLEGTEVAGPEFAVWHLNALTEALGDLTLTVSDSLSIGRGKDNDVVLGSKEVSRNHALLSVLNGQLYVKDLDSSNGTFINNERVEINHSKQLNTDDTVGFASFEFQVALPIVTEVTDSDIEQPVIIDEPVVDTVTESDTSDVPFMPTLDTQITDAEIVEDVDVNTVEDPAAIIAVEPINDSPVEPVAVEETVLDNGVSAEIIEIPVQENAALDTEIAESVVKETIIEEVLSSSVHTADVTTDMPVTALEPSMTTEQVTAMSNDMAKETLIDAPVVKEPVANTPVTPLTEEPLMQQKAVQQESSNSAGHDKTTKTALQEEADPDVLRAKQAATGQLSGTANLGQPRDIGTQGNNAMDQALSNSANAGHVEKKPSGSWFIWVFVAIVIIGLALWLFNA